MLSYITSGTPDAATIIKTAHRCALPTLKLRSCEVYNSTDDISASIHGHIGGIHVDTLILLYFKFTVVSPKILGFLGCLKSHHGFIIFLQWHRLYAANKYHK